MKDYLAAGIRDLILPQRFWHDPATRRRHYNEAEVDPGLIETAPADAIEVVIDSGFSAGVSEEGTSIVLVEFPVW